MKQLYNPEDIYRYICDTQDQQKGAPPSLREVAAHFQTSTCVVHRIFQKLVAAGRLERKGKHYVAANGTWRLRTEEDWIYG